MQVRNLLSESYKLVQNYALRPPHVFNLQRGISTWILLEEHLSWLELSTLFNKYGSQPVEEKNLNPFIQFLRERWFRINYIYQLTYPVKYKAPITNVCLALATELATLEFDGKLYHPFERLMPSINSFNDFLALDLIGQDAATEAEEVDNVIRARKAELKLTDKETLPPEELASANLKGQATAKPKKLHLHHFILDHWQNVVQIQEAIEAAVVEGIVQHTSSLTTISNEYGRVPDFQLIVLQSQAVPIPPYAANTLYIKFGEDFLAYAARGMPGFAKMDSSKIDINTLFTAKELATLNVTSAWEALRKLPSNDARKKLDLRQLEILEKVAANGHINIAKEPTHLSHQERLRIIHHSKEGYAFYAAIKAVIQERDMIANAYDAIANLRKELEKGGIRGRNGGTGAKASLPAFQGIRQFYNFTKMLTPADFDTLWKLDREDELRSFREIWSDCLSTALSDFECDFSDTEKADIYKLITPYFDNERELAQQVIEKANKSKKTAKEITELLGERRPILCSEQFSIQLGNFQARHTQVLRDMRPPSATEKDAKRLKQLEEDRDKKQKIFITAILQNKLTHFSSADYKNEARVACIETISLSQFSQAMITSIDKLICALITFPQDYHQHVFFYLLNKYEVVLKENGIHPVPQKFYVVCKSNRLKYTVVNPQGQVVNGVITNKNIKNISKVFKNFNIAKLEDFLPEIFNLTACRGHTSVNTKFLQNLVNTGNKLVILIRGITDFYQGNAERTVDLLIDILGIEFLKSYADKDSLKAVQRFLPENFFPIPIMQPLAPIITFFKRFRSVEAPAEPTSPKEDRSKRLRPLIEDELKCTESLDEKEDVEMRVDPSIRMR